MLRNKLYPLLAFLGLIPGGCQTSPGFTWGFQVTVPPTINSTNTLHPIVTQPSMSYAIEAPQGPTVIQRQYYAPQPQEAPPAPPMRPRPQMEQIPMPKAPCTPACASNNVATITGAE